MNQFTPNPWPKKDAELIRRWNMGEPTKKITDALGLNRNQILGRIRRLKADGIEMQLRGDPVIRTGVRMTPEEQADKERARAKQRYRDKVKAEGREVRAYDAERPAPVYKPKPAPAPPTPIAVKIEPPKPLLQKLPTEGSMIFSAAVENGKCLWPYGDIIRGDKVCGLDRGVGGRYCQAHHAKATEKKSGGEARINYQVKPITGINL